MLNKEIHMPLKSALDLLAVWAVTIAANVIGLFAGWLEYLPVIREILGIISILIAIAYSIYKFFAIWRGWNPRKKNNKPKQ
jgi:hypothetical protein